MSNRTEIPLEGLLDGYESALSGLGYSVSTKLLFVRRADLIIRLHLRNGLEYLDSETLSRYAQGVDERYFNGELTRRHYESIRREIERFAAYAYTGEGRSLPSPLRGAKQKVKPEFEGIAEEFLSGEFHPNTRCDMRWAIHKYFAWLEERGVPSLRETGADFIQKFLLDCAEKFSPSAVHNIRLYLKKLYAFLTETGRADFDFRELLSFKVSRERKVFPSLPKSDIAKLLDSIDRKTKTGKRDYAVMMLGTVLGIRACDIIGMKLKDIDWRSGEIKFTQSKTGNPVALPLTQDVGEALRDYILNARPDCEAQEVFVRIYAPHTALKAAVTIGEIYAKCCKAAGLSENKRFHNLRRALGTSMVSNGVSVYDVAQVFGDTNVESVKPYLAADSRHLKMCALPFDGIAPQEGGETQ